MGREISMSVERAAITAIQIEAFGNAAAVVKAVDIPDVGAPSLSWQCALLQPVDVETALRKQPRAVYLHERVEVAERSEHQASLSTVDCDVMC
jgi:hypothetical protein